MVPPSFLRRYHPNLSTKETHREERDVPPGVTRGSQTCYKGFQRRHRGKPPPGAGGLSSGIFIKEATNRQPNLASSPRPGNAPPITQLRLRLNSRPLSIDCKLAAFAQLIEVPSRLLSEAYATKHKRSRVLTSYALSKRIQAIKTTRVPTLAVRPQGLRAALPPDTPD